MPSVKDIAIVLRLLDWSETSQIAVLFTEHHGKVSATAKGAKRQTPSTLAKFSGGLELLGLGEAVFISKRPTELANLTEWDLVDAHWHLRRDLRGYRLAMYAADLVHHVVQDHDAHPVTFAALRQCLAELADRAAQPAAMLRFQWTVVEDMGLRPVLEHDAQTGEDLADMGATVAFSHVAGGVVADTGSPDRWRVRRTTIELLQQVAAGKPLNHASPEALDRANKLLCAYFRAILDRQLPTMDVILDRESDAKN